MNINEIARRAGVSRATVSRYLNNGYVSKEKRDLISQIIDETGYVPSRHAQQLRTGKTGLVGVIIPKINSQSVSRMVAGITDTLAESNYQTLLANTNNDAAKEVEYLKLLNEKNRVDGIVLIATEFTDAHRKAMDRLRVPLVVLGQHFEGCTSIYQDDYHAMYDVSKLVLSKSKQTAYLGVFDEDVAAGKMRKQGFVDACAAEGLALGPNSLQTVGFDADDGYFGAERILESIPDVDTIVCASDDIAFGAMMCMREYGRRVPEDVQITGIGDSMLSRIAYPSLTTVHLHYLTGGMRAATELLAHLNEPSHEIAHVKLGYEVYGRNSMR